MKQKTGQEAYELFCKQNPGPKGRPSWDELSGEIQGKWEDRAKADTDIADKYRKLGLPDPETMAGQLYTAFAQSHGGKLPPWDEIATNPEMEKVNDAWVMVAVEAIKLVTARNSMKANVKVGSK